MTAPTTPTAAHSMAQSLAHPAADVPPGFVPFPAGGNFMHINGPLYLLHQGEVVKFGMRVQERHINPMGNLHGGMMASFCDMLLPLSVAGLGLRELSYVALLGIFGVPPATALAVSLMVFATLLLNAAVGGLIELGSAVRPLAGGTAPDRP